MIEESSTEAPALESVSASVEYDKIRAINWSTLKYMAVSPRMYKWRLEHPEPPKTAFVFGGAVHTLILEPERFDERYAECDVVRNAKHEKYKAWLAEHPDAAALTPHEVKRIRACAAAIMEHKIAGALFKNGRREEALTWTDAATGLACKGRLDFIRPDFLVDLKTARDPAPGHFVRAASNYGYLAQVALYHDGAIAERRLDGRERPYIVAAKSGDDHDVVAFQVTAAALEYGRAFYRGLLQRLLQCTEANFWPGVAPELQELGISPYASEPFAIESGEDF